MLLNRLIDSTDYVYVLMMLTLCSFFASQGSLALVPEGMWHNNNNNNSNNNNNNNNNIYNIVQIKVRIQILYRCYMLYARVATWTCRPVSIQAGSQGCDPNLPACFHPGWQLGLRPKPAGLFPSGLVVRVATQTCRPGTTGRQGQAERKRWKGFGETVAV